MLVCVNFNKQLETASRLKELLSRVRFSMRRTAAVADYNVGIVGNCLESTTWGLRKMVAKYFEHSSASQLLTLYVDPIVKH